MASLVLNMWKFLCFRGSKRWKSWPNIVKYKPLVFLDLNDHEYWFRGAKISKMNLKVYLKNVKNIEKALKKHWKTLKVSMKSVKVVKRVEFLCLFFLYIQPFGIPFGQANPYVIISRPTWTWAMKTCTQKASNWK